MLKYFFAQIDVTFEKPTGISGELYLLNPFLPIKIATPSPSAEVWRLHPRHTRLPASSPSTLPPTALHSHHTHVNLIIAATSVVLACDILGVVKYTLHHAPCSGRSGHDKGMHNEMSDSCRWVDISAGSHVSRAGGDADVQFMQHVESIGGVASLKQRWVY